MQSQITVGSMFAGIGGICLAFKQKRLQINIGKPNEIDKYACKTLVQTAFDLFDKKKQGYKQIGI